MILISRNVCVSEAIKCLGINGGEPLSPNAPPDEAKQQEKLSRAVLVL